MINTIKEQIKLIYYIAKFNSYGVNKERIKAIYYDELIASIYIERKILKLCNATRFLFNCTFQEFNSSLLNSCFYLLTNKVLSDDLTKKIIEIYYKNVDNSPHALAAIVHLYLINCIEDYNNEFAFLISNFIMLKHKRWFIIPFEYAYYDYKKAILNNDLSKIIKLFYEMELLKKTTRPCNLTLVQLIEKFKELKEIIIKKYNVKNLFMFGSFAKKTNNENSDLDLAVLFDDSLINYERNNKIDELKSFLQMEFDCDCDLIDFSYACTAFDGKELEHLINII